MFRTTAAIAIVAAFALPAFASDITGVWLAPTRSAHVQIRHCGEAICGRVLWATTPKTNPDFLDVHNKNPELRDRRVIGTDLIEGFKGGPDKYTGGRIYNPGDGNTYHGEITLEDDNHLKLTGCALIIICKSQIWTRIE